MTIPWETVRIFISSTFDDMHAERDTLVKQVFPELREWCERRKLRLVDIDLRWGVKEEDTQNKNVVEVCLRRIDEARPFFLCFLGQRRGWVPQTTDISSTTLAVDSYPDLQPLVGKASVTEMEILHALVNPFHRSRRKKDQPGEYYDPVKYSFFYLRDPSYLAQLPKDFPPLRKVYTNEGILDSHEKTAADRELEKWVNVEIPALCAKQSRPKHAYRAKWNPDAVSPELLLPLACPSLVPDNVRQWQRKWADAGIEVTGTRIDKSIQARAEEYNRRRSSGRLGGFECDGKSLSQVILSDLQVAITARFPQHVEIGDVSDLQKELDQQEQFLYTGSEGFIERAGDFDELDAYVEGGSNNLFVLTAPGGMGKSSLLAKWVERYHTAIDDREGRSIHFRFIGQSDHSNTVYSLLSLLLREIKEAGKLSNEIPDDPQKLRQELPALLAAIGKQGKTVIVLDALNQLESGLADLSWLPYQLPEAVKLIASFKCGEKAADELLGQMQGQVVSSQVRPFEKLEHRRELVKIYLAQYLKQLDPPFLEAVINLPGAANPLYLKVVLSELRVFGAFANLGEKIRSDFGETPVSAFLAVLQRLENDPVYSLIDSKQAVPLLFGLLAHARLGLSVEELSGIFGQVLAAEKAAAADTIHLFLRQVRPFLVYREGRYDFFFESFKLAALQKYVTAQYPNRYWHRLLASYLRQLSNWEPGQLTPIRRPRLHKVSELAYHQAGSEVFGDLLDTLTDFDFLDAALTGLGPYPVIDNYDFALKTQPGLVQEPVSLKGLQLIQEALRLASQSIKEDPTQLAGQLIGRLSGFNRPEIRRVVEKATAWDAAPWLRPITPSLTPPGSPLLITLSGHTGDINAMAATPDGSRVVTAADDGTLRIWNRDRQWESIILDGRCDGVWAVAITPDGQRAISGGRDGTLRIWDLEHHIEIGSIQAHQRQVHGVAISADGQRALSASWDKKLKIWDLYWMREVATLQTNTSMLSAAAITPDGRWGLSDSDDDLIVWDLDELKQAAVLKGHSSSINAIALTPNGSFAVTGSEDKTVRVWDIRNRKSLAVLEGHEDNIYAVAITPDGQRVMSGSDDYSIRLWDVRTRKTIRQIDAHSKAVSGLMISADGRTAISASRDKTVRIWDLSRQIQTSHQVRYGGINAAALSTGGNAAAGSFTGVVSLWDFEQGQRLREHTFNASGIAALANEPGQNRMVVTLGDGTVIEWDEQDGEDILANKILQCNQMVIVGKQVLLATSRGIELVWLDGRKPPEVLARMPGPIGTDWHVDTAISKDGHRAVLSAGTMIKGGGLHIIEPIKVRELAEWPEVEGVSTLALTADGKQMVGGGSDGTLRLFDLEKKIQIGQLAGHKSRIEALSITPDGNFLASAATDGSLKVWDVRSRILLASFQDDARLICCALSPDGSHLVAGGLSGTVHLFKLQGYAPPAKLEESPRWFSLFSRPKEKKT